MASRLPFDLPPSIADALEPVRYDELALPAELEAQIAECRAPDAELQDAANRATLEHLEAAHSGKQSPTLPSPRSVRSFTAVREMEAFMSKHALTLEQFAERSVISRKTLSKFRKTGELSHSVFRDLARALRVEPTDLLDETSPNFP